MSGGYSGPRRGGAPAAYGGPNRGSSNGSSSGRAPSVFSRGTASMTGESSFSSSFSPPVYGGYGMPTMTAVPPPLSVETPEQRQAREAEQRSKNMAMHFRDHMSLPPFVVNGDPLYDAHELPATAPARLIRAADFQRQAEDARLVFNNDPARKWTKPDNQRYPEPINNNKFGIPPPVMAHPLLPGPNTYRMGDPGPTRVWSNTNDSTKAEVLYHNEKEKERRRERVLQDERDLTASLDRLSNQRRAARGAKEQNRLQGAIDRAEAKRNRVREQIAAPIKKNAPFTLAAYIPVDTQCAPLVPVLANPHRRQYDQEQGCHVLTCQQCGGRALVSDEGKIVQRCPCTPGT